MLCNAPFWLKLAHSAQILAFSTKIFPASWLACNSLRMAAGSDPTWDHQKFPKFLFLFYNIYKLIYNVSHSFLSLFNVKWLVTGKKVRFQPIVRASVQFCFLRKMLFVTIMYFCDSLSRREIASRSLIRQKLIISSIIY